MSSQLPERIRREMKSPRYSRRKAEIDQLIEEHPEFSRKAGLRGITRKRRAVQRQPIDDLHTWLREVQGYETFSSLSNRKGISEAEAQAWVEAQVKAGELFTVTHQDHVLIPRVLFTETGSINGPVSELAYALRSANIGEWHTWVWLVSPSGLLSGDIPAEVVQEDQSRALTAAQRHIAEIRRATGHGDVA